MLFELKLLKAEWRFSHRNCNKGIADEKWIQYKAEEIVRNTRPRILAYHLCGFGGTMLSVEHYEVLHRGEIITEHN